MKILLIPVLKKKDRNDFEPFETDNKYYLKMKENMDDMLLKLSVVAFVSYIRSYKEHIVNYILAYKELDFDGLADLFFLVQPPGMHELKKIKFKKFERPVKK